MTPGGESVTQDLLQNHSIIVLLVFRPVDKRGRAFGDGLFQEGKLGGVVFELGLIAGLELAPLGWVVGKPLAQLAAGSDFLEPEVDASLLFGKAARPEPVDEDARAIGLGGLFVDALEFYLHGWCSFCAR